MRCPSNTFKTPLFFFLYWNVLSSSLRSRRVPWDFAMQGFFSAFSLAWSPDNMLLMHPAREVQQLPIPPWSPKEIAIGKAADPKWNLCCWLSPFLEPPDPKVDAGRCKSVLLASRIPLLPFYGLLWLIANQLMWEKQDPAPGYCLQQRAFSLTTLCQKEPPVYKTLRESTKFDKSSCLLGSGMLDLAYGCFLNGLLRCITSQNSQTTTHSQCDFTKWTHYQNKNYSSCKLITLCPVTVATFIRTALWEPLI